LLKKITTAFTALAAVFALALTFFGPAAWPAVKDVFKEKAAAAETAVDSGGTAQGTDETPAGKVGGETAGGSGEGEKEIDKAAAYGQFFDPDAEPRKLSLEEALRLAEENNPDFKLAELEKDRAGIEADQAENTADKIKDAKETYGLGYTVEDALVVFVNEKQKKALDTIAEKSYEAAKKGLELQIVQKYYAVLEAEKMLEVKQAALERARQQLKQARVAYEVGTVARTDLLAAEVGMSSVEAELTSAQNDYRLAVIELNRVIGLELDTPLELTSKVEFESLGEVDLDEVIEQAMEERLDIVSKREMKAVADENYRVCKGYSAANTYVARLAKIDAEKAAVELEKTKKAAVADLTSAYLNVLAAEKALKALQGSVKLAEENMRLTSLRYEVGLATTLDVLNASEKLSEVQAQYVQALFRHNLAKLSFETAKITNVPLGAMGGTGGAQSSDSHM